jgi:3-isopropylmalate/(R)-2-methylmalate dehydratase small subunit
MSFEQEAIIKFQGRAWVFGNNINTDLMFPNVAYAADEQERRRLVFSANRPGWSSQVAAGDLIVGGQNFGTGSGRPGFRYIKELGVAAIVAESINGLFFRNCINSALPVMECPGVSKLVTEGDSIAVDFDAATVTNLATGATLNAARLPPMLLGILAAGGVVEILTQQGFLNASSYVSR